VQKPNRTTLTNYKISYQKRDNLQGPKPYRDIILPINEEIIRYGCNCRSMVENSAAAGERVLPLR
jgi:hypothetical protein